MLKKYVKALILLFFGCLFFSVTVCYAQFTVQGELRPRTELRRGYKTLPASGAEAAFFTEQRSRLILGYSKEAYDLGFSLQDVRIWGSQSQLNKSDGLFSVHEAWGKINFNESLSLKAGRQELVYDDHRILGNVGWTAQGRSHDALLFMATRESWALHTGFAFNQDMNTPESVKLFDTFYSGAGNYKTLQYLWFRVFRLIDFSFLALNNGVQTPDSTINFTQTIGTRASFKPSDFMVDGSLYYQTGKDPAGLDVQAWLASLSTTYTGFDNFKLTIGGDYLSGSRANNDQNNSFNPLYGTHHKFYGFMDYFYVGNPHSQRVGSNSNATGLVDLFLKTSIRLSSVSSLLVFGHEFFSPVEILDPADPSRTLSSRLGTEIDLVFGHSLTDEVTIQAGYSQMFATSSLEALKGGSKGQLANWAWLMLSFNPVFFTTKY